MALDLAMKTISHMHSQIRSLTRERDVLSVEKTYLVKELTLLRKALLDIANGADVRETALKALADRR